jgi:hypothetical protein
LPPGVPYANEEEIGLLALASYLALSLHDLINNLAIVHVALDTSHTVTKTLQHMATIMNIGDDLCSHIRMQTRMQNTNTV